MNLLVVGYRDAEAHQPGKLFLIAFFLFSLRLGEVLATALFTGLHLIGHHFAAGRHDGKTRLSPNNNLATQLAPWVCCWVRLLLPWTA